MSPAQNPSCPIQVDDGFQAGTCCQPLAGPPNLPSSFPLGTEIGKFGCFLDCALEQEFLVDVNLAGISLDACDNLTFTMFVTPNMAGGSGTPTMTSVGAVNGKYSRTFLVPCEIRQVWRFVINGVFSFGMADIAPCPVPACYNVVGGFTQVPFSGFLDISCGVDPVGQGGNGWHFALSLTHEAGCFSHKQHPYNAQPLPPSPIRHDDRSFHLVAPVPFTFLPTTFAHQSQITISSTLDAVRSNGDPTAPRCLAESPVVVNVAHSSVTCTCPNSAMNPPIYFNQTVQGSSVTCTNTQPFSSLPSPTEIPTGFVQAFIGRWGGAAIGHRDTFLFSSFGVFGYRDADCHATAPMPATPMFDWHIVFGGTTVYDGMGCQPQLFPSNPVSVLTDLANALDPQNPPVPIQGQRVISSIVWQLSQ